MSLSNNRVPGRQRGGLTPRSSADPTRTKLDLLAIQRNPNDVLALIKDLQRRVAALERRG